MGEISRGQRCAHLCVDLPGERGLCESISAVGWVGMCRLVFAEKFMEVFYEADGDHDRRTCQTKEENALDQGNGKMNDGVHDAHSTAR